MEQITEFVKSRAEDLLRTLEELSVIPAPSGEETKRQDYLTDWLARRKLPCEKDQAGNLVIPWQIQPGRDNLMVTAHMDLVFDKEVPLKLKKDGQIWSCPGIGDNTCNVVLLLFLAEYLFTQKPGPGMGIYLVIDTCEEGLGNLAGCRELMKTCRNRIREFLALDLYQDQIYTGCIGSARYEITAKTAGGHSFGDFGRTNAIWVLGELVSRLYQYQVPENTTYNVGKIIGGTSVNTIAQEAQMLFEYRSDKADELEKGKAFLYQKLEEMRAYPDVLMECRTVGERPCAQNPDEKRIQEMAELCSREIQNNCKVMPLKAKASTDCNVPLSCGIPAVCAGFFRGSGAHTLEEWIDVGTAEPALTTVIRIVTELMRGKKA